jgi:hypothetical protein
VIGSVEVLERGENPQPCTAGKISRAEARETERFVSVDPEAPKPTASRLENPSRIGVPIPKRGTPGRRGTEDPIRGPPEQNGSRSEEEPAQPRAP